MNESLLVDEREAAAIIGLKPRMLRDVRRRGEIEFVRVGRMIRYRREALEQFVDRMRVPARS